MRIESGVRNRRRYVAPGRESACGCDDPEPERREDRSGSSATDAGPIAELTTEVFAPTVRDAVLRQAARVQCAETQLHERNGSADRHRAATPLWLDRATQTELSVLVIAPAVRFVGVGYTTRVQPPRGYLLESKAAVQFDGRARRFLQRYKCDADLSFLVGAPAETAPFYRYAARVEPTDP